MKKVTFFGGPIFNRTLTQMAGHVEPGFPAGTFTSPMLVAESCFPAGTFKLSLVMKHSNCLLMQTVEPGYPQYL
jgi:hypothetical protein